MAHADTAPPTGTPATVSADALPTVQINGVVWAQTIVGNTVYATGEFTKARPAGSAAGVNETTRTNLLAYNVTTGALITSFNHSLNGDGLAITASPDGSRVYVVGAFTSVDGQTRNRAAAFDTATGALVSGFAPNLQYTARAVVATNSTVYIGGSFTTASGSARSRLAAYTSAGALTTWAPSTNDSVTAMVLSPDATRVVVAGRFTALNGTARIGIGAVSSSTGASTTWDANFPILDSGSAATYTSLVSDGTNIYGTAYQFTTGGNFEGRFSANPYTGAIVWLNSCHGDSYGSWVVGQVLYSVGHAHDCSDAEDYSQDNNNIFASTHHYAMAESTTVTGTERQVVLPGGPNIPGPRYADWAGYKHSGELNWYPTFTQGTYTGQSQAAWSVTGNSNYVSVGGEFPTVNGTAQQGLVRFAVKSLAPNSIGPASTTQLTPTAVSLSAGTAHVSFRTTSDQDNVTLTYKLYRDGGSTPIWTTTVDSRFWYRPALSYNDTGLAAGSTHTYKVTATDPGGIVRTSSTSSSVTIGSATPSAYTATVLGDGAANFWPLSESSGTTGVDYAGGNNLTLGSSVTRGTAGPSAAGSATASTFDGTLNAITASKGNGERRTGFSVEAWVKTTSTTGGEVVGYGIRNVESSADADRTIYLSADGKPYFGVWSNNTRNTVNGASAINNGAWHHLVGAVSATGGMSLYVDGALVSSKASVTSTSVLSGYWRVGGDWLLNWPSAPQPAGGPGSTTSTAGYLSGSIADVAVYPSALSATQVANHFGGTVTPVTPTGTIGADAFGRTASSGWGTADTGGGWTVSGTASQYSVANGAGVQSVPAGVTDTSTLAGASSTSSDTTAKVAVATAGGAIPSGAVTLNVNGRVVGASSYGAQVIVAGDGSVTIAATKNGASLASSPVSGLTWALTPTQFQVRVQVQGTSPTTIRARVWQVGTTEPTTWTVTTTDSTAALQSAGGVSLGSTSDSGITNGPVVVQWDDLAVTTL